METGLGSAEDPTNGHEDVPERAGQAHLWFKADSPAGPVFVAHANGWVSGLKIMPEGRELDPGRFVDYMRDEVGEDVEPDPDPDPRLVARVSEALATGRTDVPVDLSSRSPFHQEVLRATARIPRGEVRTYGELAEIVGRPRAARAVGTAMARNPVPLLVPCHRVVPSSGGVGNYGFGSDLKGKLLADEGVVL
jgi:methylated-DNA-[protein]-cysteine S-methyltransferase